jgi:hypothetical protein
MNPAGHCVASCAEVQGLNNLHTFAPPYDREALMRGSSQNDFHASLGEPDFGSCLFRQSRKNWIMTDIQIHENRRTACTL